MDFTVCGIRTLAQTNGGVNSSNFFFSFFKVVHFLNAVVSILIFKLSYGFNLLFGFFWSIIYYLVYGLLKLDLRSKALWVASQILLN